MAEEGERRLPAHGGERLAVKELKAKGGLGLRLKQRGLGHRQVHPRPGLLSAASPEMAGVPGGRTQGRAPLWTVLQGALGLSAADTALSPTRVTLSCQLPTASGYGQKSGPASQPRTNSDPLQLGTEPETVSHSGQASATRQSGASLGRRGRSALKTLCQSSDS